MTMESDEMFNTILERMVDAERREATAVEGRDTANQVLRQESSALAAERIKNSALKEQDKANKPKLAALWVAAQTMLGRFECRSDNDEAARKNLKKALEDAHDACDQIPF